MQKDIWQEKDSKFRDDKGIQLYCKRTLNFPVLGPGPFSTFQEAQEVPVLILIFLLLLLLLSLLRASHQATTPTATLWCMDLNVHDFMSYQKRKRPLSYH